MINLNLPTYNFRIKNKENKLYIFDIVRKKNVILTPEEWVRQHFIHYLLEEKNYPGSLMSVEKQLKINQLVKRTDILIYDRKGMPNIIVECKAPSIKISQNTFDQIARYNLKLQAKYLILTNGLKHYYCKMDHQKERYDFLADIPAYSTNK